MHASAISKADEAEILFQDEAPPVELEGSFECSVLSVSYHLTSSRARAPFAVVTLCVESRVSLPEEADALIKTLKDGSQSKSSGRNSRVHEEEEEDVDFEIEEDGGIHREIRERARKISEKMEQTAPDESIFHEVVLTMLIS